MKRGKPITNRSGRVPRLKRAAMLFMLATACAVLSACYMDPDPVADVSNGLTIGQNDQNFNPVITPTPEVTATPTPAPTSNALDWDNWVFGDEATNPPSNVSPTTGTDTSDGTTGNTGTTATTAPQIGSATTAPVISATATPTASASTTLKLGDKGDAVKRLQQRLKDLGYLTGSVDGSFGQATEQAVRDFQAANGLTVDGKAGTRTQTVLYGSGAKKKTAATATAKPKSTTTTTSSSGSSSSGGSSSTANSYTNGRTDIYLDINSSNASQIKIMQNRLIVLGYLTGTADGVYGETTEAAVIAFQKRNNLYADGKAGPDTLSVLYSASAKKASSVAGHLGSLKEGMNGSSVRTLQTNLKTLGYYTGSVDGDYGSGTTAAVTAFQAANGLTADGIAGKATLNAISAAINGTGSSSSGSSSGSGTSPSVYGNTASSNGYTTISASSGSSTANVTALQSALQATGYYSGTVDGSYGSGTTAAVEAFQKAAGLRVTGVAGPSTQRLLYGGTSASGSYTKLQLGSTGSSVKALQYALYELKYYDGNITGTYDNATCNAVMVFQEQNGLTVDGIAGQATQQRLYSSSAIPCSI